MKRNGRDDSRSRDPRLLPAYSLGEASHYLRIPYATLRSWIVGRTYPVKHGRGTFQPVIVPAQKAPPLLSFINLVEAHLLGAIRRKHEIALPKVRAAVAYVRRQFGTEHPLAEQRMLTDGQELFVQKFGKLIAVSQAGQLAFLEVLKAHLERIEWDEAGIAVRLFPFTRRLEGEEPKSIVIDPRISFGRPVLFGTGIATAVIAERFKAGESVDELAEDYGRNRLEIQDAIRCELALEAA